MIIKTIPGIKMPDFLCQLAKKIEQKKHKWDSLATRPFTSAVMLWKEDLVAKLDGC